MNKYEGMFLIDSRPFQKGWEEARDLVHSILTKHGAKVLESGKWDERKLSFEVKKQKRGLYLLVYFECPTKALGDIERDCQLNDSVLRILVLRLEGEIPKEPFKPAPVIDNMASRPHRDTSVDSIPELAELEASGPVDWEEQ